MKKLIFLLLSVMMVSCFFGDTTFAATEIASGECGETLTWILDDEGTLTILGTGEFYNYSTGMDTPWYKCATRIKRIVVTENVTNIGAYAFAYCSNVIEAQLLGDISVIGQSAFYACKKLISISLPNSVTSIGKNSFRSCESLNSIILPSNVNKVGEHAFWNCSNLKSAVLSENMTVCENGIFYGCSALTDIDLKNVIEIGDYVFRGCSSLEKINFPASIKIIGNSTFYCCDKLTSVSLPIGINSIGWNAFGYEDDELTGEDFIKKADFTLYGYKNNPASRYASNNGISFVSLGWDMTHNTYITLSSNKYTYSGEEIKPDVKVTIGENVLNLNEDYTVRYVNNIKAGTATVEIIGINGNVGTVSKTFNILKGKFDTASIGEYRYEYTGNEIRPEVSVYSNERLLKKDVDYTVSYENNINAGAARVIIIGTGNYDDSKSVTYEILRNIQDADIQVFDCYYGEYGSDSWKDPIVSIDNKVLRSGIDYIVISIDDRQVGTSYIRIKGTGNYFGLVEKGFTIKPKKIGISDIKLTNVSLMYSDIIQNNNPGVAVYNSVYYDGKISRALLGEDTDYKLTYKNNSTPGIATVIISGKGNYTGTVSKNFVLLPNAPTVVKTSLYGYDDVKVWWNKSTGATGYIVYYKKSTEQSYSKLGTTSLTYMNKANLADGVKYIFKVVPYIIMNNKQYVSKSINSSSIYTLKKVSTPIVKKYSRTKVIIQWANISGETGYQISRTTSKTGTSIVYTYNTTTGKSKVLSATRGKTYYYKVRAYRIVSGKKIYGPWSAVRVYKLR